MVRIDVRYEGGLHCSAVHEPSGSTLATDAPVDNQGRGESFSPTDLVATALGTCMATIMGIVADRHGWNIDGTSMRIAKEMTTDGPRRIRQLGVVVDSPAALDDEARRTLENAAHTCPVRLSILPAIDVPVEFHWGKR
ncbi:MAG TPA: OsmC family protein [Candidatus Limnocylindrales bacterium]|nr:OsmC family protein [Candidatus Limnocylindrales bacterium]